MNPCSFLSACKVRTTCILSFVALCSCNNQPEVDTQVDSDSRIIGIALEETSHSGYIPDVAQARLSPSGSRLGLLSTDGSLYVYEVANGSLVHKVTPSIRWADSVAIHHGPTRVRIEFVDTILSWWPDDGIGQLSKIVNAKITDFSYAADDTLYFIANVVAPSTITSQKRSKHEWATVNHPLLGRVDCTNKTWTALRTPIGDGKGAWVIPSSLAVDSLGQYAYVPLLRPMQNEPGALTDAPAIGKINLTTGDLHVAALGPILDSGETWANFTDQPIPYVLGEELFIGLRLHAGMYSPTVRTLRHNSYMKDLANSEFLESIDLNTESPSLDLIKYTVQDYIPQRNGSVRVITLQLTRDSAYWYVDEFSASGRWSRIVRLSEVRKCTGTCLRRVATSPGGDIITIWKDEVWRINIIES